MNWQGYITLIFFLTPERFIYTHPKQLETERKDEHRKIFLLSPNHKTRTKVNLFIRTTKPMSPESYRSRKRQLKDVFDSKFDKRIRVKVPNRFSLVNKEVEVKPVTDDAKVKEKSDDYEDSQVFKTVSPKERYRKKNIYALEHLDREAYYNERKINPDFHPYIQDIKVEHAPPAKHYKELYEGDDERISLKLPTKPTRTNRFNIFNDLNAKLFELFSFKTSAKTEKRVHHHHHRKRPKTKLDEVSEPNMVRSKVITKNDVNKDVLTTIEANLKNDKAIGTSDIFYIVPTSKTNFIKSQVTPTNKYYVLTTTIADSTKNKETGTTDVFYKYYMVPTSKVNIKNVHLSLRPTEDLNKYNVLTKADVTTTKEISIANDKNKYTERHKIDNMGKRPVMNEDRIKEFKTTKQYMPYFVTDKYNRYILVNVTPVDDSEDVKKKEKNMYFVTNEHSRFIVINVTPTTVKKIDHINLREKKTFKPRTTVGSRKTLGLRKTLASRKTLKPRQRLQQKTRKTLRLKTLSRSRFKSKSRVKEPIPTDIFNRKKIITYYKDNRIVSQMPTDIFFTKTATRSHARLHSLNKDEKHFKDKFNTKFDKPSNYNFNEVKIIKYATKLSKKTNFGEDNIPNEVKIIRYNAKSHSDDFSKKTTKKYSSDELGKIIEFATKTQSHQDLSRKSTNIFDHNVSDKTKTIKFPTRTQFHEVSTEREIKKDKDYFSDETKLLKLDTKAHEGVNFSEKSTKTYNFEEEYMDSISDETKMIRFATKTSTEHFGDGTSNEDKFRFVTRTSLNDDLSEKSTEKYTFDDETMSSEVKIIKFATKTKSDDNLRKKTTKNDDNISYKEKSSSFATRTPLYNYYNNKTTETYTFYDENISNEKMLIRFASKTELSDHLSNFDGKDTLDETTSDDISSKITTEMYTSDEEIKPNEVKLIMFVSKIQSNDNISVQITETYHSEDNNLLDEIKSTRSAIQSDDDFSKKATEKYTFFEEIVPNEVKLIAFVTRTHSGDDDYKRKTNEKYIFEEENLTKFATRTQSSDKIRLNIRTKLHDNFTEKGTEKYTLKDSLIPVKEKLIRRTNRTTKFDYTVSKKSTKKYKSIDKTQSHTIKFLILTTEMMLADDFTKGKRKKCKSSKLHKSENFSKKNAVPVTKGRILPKDSSSKLPISLAINFDQVRIENEDIEPTSPQQTYYAFHAEYLGTSADTQPMTKYIEKTTYPSFEERRTTRDIDLAWPTSVARPTSYKTYPTTETATLRHLIFTNTKPWREHEWSRGPTGPEGIYYDYYNDYVNNEFISKWNTFPTTVMTCFKQILDQDIPTYTVKGHWVNVPVRSKMYGEVFFQYLLERVDKYSTWSAYVKANPCFTKLANFYGTTKVIALFATKTGNKSDVLRLSKREEIPMYRKDYVVLTEPQPLTPTTPYTPVSTRKKFKLRVNTKPVDESSATLTTHNKSYLSEIVYKNLFDKKSKIFHKQPLHDSFDIAKSNKLKQIELAEKNTRKMNKDVIAHCYVCGFLKGKDKGKDRIPGPECYNAFAGEVKPRYGPNRLEMKWRCAQTKGKDSFNVKEKKAFSKSYTGGCYLRYLDVGVVYNERGCRRWPDPEIGVNHKDLTPTEGSFASKRFARLEKLLKRTKDGCVVSPHATLTPFSRAISLYARYHVCVCTGRWCNMATASQPDCVFVALILGLLLRL